jgi:hypothetical protein
MLIVSIPAGVAADVKPLPKTLFVAASGSDRSSCTRTSPCATFDRAYRLARGGQVVEVAGGTYPAQTINADRTKSDQDVVFRPAADATVSVPGRITVNASHVRFIGTATSADVRAGVRRGFDVFSVAVAVAGTTVPSYVTLENVNMHSLFIAGAHHITVKGGQAGDLSSCLFHVPKDPCEVAGQPMLEDAVQVKSVMRQPSGDYIAHDIVFDGITVHDVRKPTCAEQPYSCTAHTDCIQFYSIKNVTLRNSTFYNCSDTDFFVGFADPAPAGIDGFVVENNVFGKITYRGFFSAQVSASGAGGRICTNVVFRYNTVEGQGVAFQCSGGNAANVQVYGNILPSSYFGACRDATWRYNFYSLPTSSTCDATETVRAPVVRVLPPSVRGRSATLRYVIAYDGPTREQIVTSWNRRVLFRKVTTPVATAPGYIRSVVWRTRRDERAASARICVRSWPQAGGRPSRPICVVPSRSRG